MHLSFDLDSTLIPNGNEFATAPRSKLAQWLGVEAIRKGAPALIKDLQAQGHVVHIYTTSYRSSLHIRKTLAYYGIFVNKIVTEKENRKKLQQLQINASKYLPAFGFELHIDDLEGVGKEGAHYGYKVLIIKPEDKEWVSTVLTELEKYFM